jgi:hypothetical protein
MTRYPGQEWMEQQARNATMEEWGWAALPDQCQLGTNRPTSRGHHPELDVATEEMTTRKLRSRGAQAPLPPAVRLLVLLVRCIAALTAKSYSGAHSPGPNQKPRLIPRSIRDEKAAMDRITGGISDASFG